MQILDSEGLSTNDVMPKRGVLKNVTEADGEGGDSKLSVKEIGKIAVFKQFEVIPYDLCCLSVHKILSTKGETYFH